MPDPVLVERLALRENSGPTSVPVAAVGAVGAEAKVRSELQIGPRKGEKKEKKRVHRNGTGEEKNGEEKENQGKKGNSLFPALLGRKINPSRTTIMGDDDEHDNPESRDSNGSEPNPSLAERLINSLNSPPQENQQVSDNYDAAPSPGHGHEGSLQHRASSGDVRTKSLSESREWLWPLALPWSVYDEAYQLGRLLRKEEVEEEEELCGADTPHLSECCDRSTDDMLFS